MNKILILAEGKRTEPKLFEKYLSELRRNYSNISEFDLKIVSYASNIYTLYNRIKKYEQDGVIYTTTIEILNEIYEENHDEYLKEVLNQDYSEIYLIFDLEYQDKLFKTENKEKILNEMLDLFNNETENGLLFINYPMIEAYRHWKNKDQIINEYKDSIILCSKAKTYKRDMNDIGSIYDINRYTMDMFKDITKANVMKSYMLVNGDYNYPSYSEFRNLIDGKRILKNEFKCIEKGNIFVLCTAMFIFLNYYGEKLYEEFRK